MIKSNNRKYSVSLLILLGFVLYFAYDIYTLKSFYLILIFYLLLSIPPMVFKRLLNGEFPLWNPYWGIGQLERYGLPFHLTYILF